MSAILSRKTADFAIKNDSAIFRRRDNQDVYGAQGVGEAVDDGTLDELLPARSIRMADDDLRDLVFADVADNLVCHIAMQRDNRHFQADNAPLLIRIETNSGHGASNPSKAKPAKPAWARRKIELKGGNLW